MPFGEAETGTPATLVIVNSAPCPGFGIIINCEPRVKTPGVVAPKMVPAKSFSKVSNRNRPCPPKLEQQPGPSPPLTSTDPKPCNFVVTSLIPPPLPPAATPAEQA